MGKSLITCSEIFLQNAGGETSGPTRAARPGLDTRQTRARWRPAISDDRIRDIEEVLIGCSLFSSLDPARLRRLAGVSRIQRLSAGEILYRAGAPVPGLFVVQKGQVRMFQAGTDGQEHVLLLAGPGMPFGYVAVLGRFPAPAGAQATCATSCVLLPSRPLQELLREDHELCLQTLASMSRWIYHLATQVERLSVRDSAQKVADYLLQMSAGPSGALQLPGRKKDVASHLGLTAETLSRVLGQLKKQRILTELPGGRFRVERPDVLRQMADGLCPMICAKRPG